MKRINVIEQVFLLLAECDIVVDVGGEFDAAQNRFDHHQRTFSHSLNRIVQYIIFTFVTFSSK